MRAQHGRLAGLFFVFFVGLLPQAQAQVSLSTLDVPYTQEFDTLPASGSATWTNNSTIAGWYHARTGTGTTIVASDGSNTAGNLYSYGTGTATDRSLGSLGSGNAAIGNLFWGVRLQNNTGATITSLDVAYVGEQWRNSAAAAQTIAFSYVVGAPTVTGSLAEFQSTGTAVAALDFTSPITGGSAAALNGNLAANRSAISATITGLSIPNGSEIMLRWSDPDHTGADHGLSIDSFSVTPHGSLGGGGVTLSINDVTLAEGNAGITPFTFTVSLSAAAPAGGVTFDIATADGTATTANNDYAAKSLTGQTIPQGSTTYSFTVLVNGDTTVEPNETFFVNVTNITNATVGDAQGQGTITNDDGVTITPIHDVQGNGAATPIPGATVTVEGVVVANFQGTDKLSGFFLQEETTDVDADPATSEGIFIFCNSCPTAVAEGQRVRATGVVSEFNGTTEITASTAGAITITNAGNNLASVTPASIDLPIVGSVDAYYESREGMLVTFVDSLTVSEYFEMARYGQVELYEGGRPFQFTEHNAPSVAGYNAWLDQLSRRRVILDDDDNVENAPLALPEGQQFVFYPRANGGLSVGTQGVDYFRGGDVVNALTGVLHYSWSGVTGTDAWRIRPSAATPANFTVTNPRPATAPSPGGAIRAVGMNMLNYFTTIDTTASNNSGPCGPSGGEDCRGADSAAELNRQRERASVVICGLNPDVAGLVEMENTSATATINDLLGAVNARCGSANPYTFVNTGGTVGPDVIRVFLIYRTGVLSPVGSPLVDLNAVHNRPPIAQTFDVVLASNAAFGQRFTVIANHFKSKGSCPGSGVDSDQGDGASCWNSTRTAQANRLLTWINGTVVPAAGDPDVLLVGDFNSYASEDPVTALEAGGYTDLTTHFDGASTYSYVFDGQLGHLDFGFASASLLPQVKDARNWHINADEIPLFSYDDEVKDTGEAAFEEKPDGSALVPPRVLYQPATAVRAADHDPVIVGLFGSADLAVTKTDSPDPVTAGSNLTYTITVTNNGPDAAASASMSDTLPAGTTFVSLPAVGGWSCTTPAVGAGGAVTCTNASMAVGSAVFTLTVNVGASVAGGTVLSNTATVSTSTGDSNSGNNSATATTTVSASADLSITKTDSPDPVNAGSNLTYTITATNAGPSNAASTSVSDTLPAGTTFVSLSSPGGWSCTTPVVGAGGTVSCTNASMAVGNAAFTLVVNVGAGVASGTVLSNTATVSSSTTDATPGNNSATSTTTVAASADLSITKTDTPDPVNAGQNITYTITVANAGPSNAANASLSDTLPAGTTFVSLSSPGGWSCTTPAVGAGGTVSCTNASFATGNAAFTLVVNVAPSTASGTVLSNTATISSSTTDATPGNNSATATTTVGASADLSITKTDAPDPVAAGSNITYTLTLTNGGPSNAGSVTLSDSVPANTTFVALSSPGGWSCTTPAVGATGAISCTIASFSPGSSTFTLVVAVNAATANGTVISNTATVSASTTDPTPANNSATATTTVVGQSADLSVTKTDSPDPVTAGNNITYTITVSNAGPNAAANVTLTDSVPANTTFVVLSSPGGWSCTTPAVGATGSISCTNASMIAGSASFTLVVAVDGATAGGTVITNTASVSSTTTDPSPANNSATATTTVAAAAGSADLSVTNVDSPDPVVVGSNISYTIGVTNAGPNAATSASLSIPIPANTSFVSLSSAAGWSCTTPAVGATGTVSCTNASFAVGTSNFTLVVRVDTTAPAGSTITATATVTSATSDPSTGNESATATTSVLAPANVSGTKSVT
ncbi:MAG: ExeM/NucH family extracellular endonuclease, partial [Acidobacteria bacterium]|nr:ExeM/NucH family extracellular endonuclease [Acidobacteriota bacterium]